jgi:hypothetical protein
MSKTKKLCSGCHDDFYNNRQNFSQFGCWSFKTARVVKRAFVHVDQVPPWHNPLVTTLDCHHRSRYITVERGHPQLKPMEPEEGGRDG